MDVFQVFVKNNKNNLPFLFYYIAMCYFGLISHKIPLKYI